MPYFVFREIWTPFTLFGVRLFREIESNALYVKFGNKKRRRLFKDKK
ncbi:MAG: hypothetical protein GX994_00375 [Firmicutes bacterium]|nr:hypothetical protein [Bacillota bacterium]